MLPFPVILLKRSIGLISSLWWNFVCSLSFVEEKGEEETSILSQATSMIYCKEMIKINSFFMMGLLVSFVLAKFFFKETDSNY